MHDRGSIRREFEGVRSEIVEDSMYVGGSPDEATKKLQQGTLRRYLVEEMTTAAKEHALAIGASTDEFRELAAAGIYVVDCLQGSMYEWGEDSLQKRWNFWCHRRNPWLADSIIKGECKPPYMERSYVEKATSKYLDLPYRSQKVERTIVDMLVAVEIYAFAEETRVMFKERLGGLLALIFPPFEWWERAMARGRIRKVVLAMVTTYHELGSDGVVSARRIREVATKATDAGVVWPGPLFALLDDNIARSGRM